MEAPHRVRRSDREITDPAHIEQIISGGTYVTLALVDRGQPYAVPLSYGYDSPARRLYFHVAHEGHKLDVIDVSPSACGTIVLDGGYNQGECEHVYQSAVLRGTMRRVETEDEKRHAIETLVNHLEDDPASYWDSRSWGLHERLGGFTALCLEIDSVTAKAGR